MATPRVVIMEVRDGKRRGMGLEIYVGVDAYCMLFDQKTLPGIRLGAFPVPGIGQVQTREEIYTADLQGVE